MLRIRRHERRNGREEDDSEPNAHPTKVWSVSRFELFRGSSESPPWACPVTERRLSDARADSVGQGFWFSGDDLDDTLVLLNGDGLRTSPS
jgi:hypothetical protein